jgi:hypothetical protein
MTEELRSLDGANGQPIDGGLDDLELLRTDEYIDGALTARAVKR